MATDVPVEAVKVTEFEHDLFGPLSGRLREVKVEAYRKGRDDARRAVLAELGQWRPTSSGRRGGKSVLQDLVTRVAVACGEVVDQPVETAEEFGRHRHTCAKLRNHADACDCGGYR